MSTQCHILIGVSTYLIEQENVKGLYNCLTGIVMILIMDNESQGVSFMTILFISIISFSLI